MSQRKQDDVSAIRLPDVAPKLPCLFGCTCTGSHCGLVTTRRKWRKKLGVSGWVTRAVATQITERGTRSLARHVGSWNCRWKCCKTLEDRLGKEAAWQRLLNKEACSQLLQLSHSQRHELFGQFRAAVKENILEDPDMFQWVRKLYIRIVDSSMDHIEMEMERAIGAYYISEEDESASSTVFGCEDELDSDNIWAYVLLLAWRVRAFLLYHFFPCDKSIFGRLKDPVYVIIYLMTLFPTNGLRVVVFTVLFVCLLASWPPEQYQMVNFLLIFKGTTFMSQGFITMSWGCWKYYACYSWHKANVLLCDAYNGPVSSYGDVTTLLVDYLGTVFLTWASFAAWYKADPFRRRHNHERTDCARKGLLRNMLLYDVSCFLLSLLILTCLNYQTWHAAESFHRFWPQLMANIFWCKSVNALLSFPFALYSIPLLQTIFTHTDPTGYDCRGRVCEFRYAVPQADEGDLEDNSCNDEAHAFPHSLNSRMAEFEDEPYRLALAMANAKSRNGIPKAHSQNGYA